MCQRYYVTTNIWKSRKRESPAQHDNSHREIVCPLGKRQNIQQRMQTYFIRFSSLQICTGKRTLIYSLCLLPYRITKYSLMSTESLKDRSQKGVYYLITYSISLVLSRSSRATGDIETKCLVIGFRSRRIQ